MSQKSESDLVAAAEQGPLEAASAPEPLQRPSFAFARRHGVLVGELLGEQVQVTARNDVTPMALVELRRFLQRPIQLQKTSADQFDRLLQTAYEGGSADSAIQMAAGLDEDLDLQRAANELPEPEDLLESEDDAPIIRLINALFTEAIKSNTSDIHIEPYEDRLTVRFRVDGELREVLQPRRVIAPLLVSRIKVMAKLDIAEKRVPQDGRISLRIAGRAVDVRVSTLPSAHGERVVLRLLDKQAGRLDLLHLGMAQQSLDLMDQLIHKPHGIILVTGPTGSGKTTTLYAALERLNDRRRNIMTVEDPVEYFLDGVAQTQVNGKVDMSFARGLRAILRQDPDVVMVGEIRDLETAEIAVQASLTGHLVFSTLHTNTAVGAVTRLRDMGIEPFLLSSSLLGVLAQRLVRMLCANCRIAYPASHRECEVLGVDSNNPPKLYKPGSCSQCNHSGYRGRSGIYELIMLDNAMRDLIHDGCSEAELTRYARTKTPSISADGARRALAGETTLEEVMRVTREE